MRFTDRSPTGAPQTPMGVLSFLIHLIVKDRHTVLDGMAVDPKQCIFCRILPNRHDITPHEFLVFCKDFVVGRKSLSYLHESRNRVFWGGIMEYRAHFRTKTFWRLWETPLEKSIMLAEITEWGLFVPKCGFLCIFQHKTSR